MTVKTGFSVELSDENINTEISGSSGSVGPILSAGRSGRKGLRLNSSNTAYWQGNLGTTPSDQVAIEFSRIFKTRNTGRICTFFNAAVEQFTFGLNELGQVELRTGGVAGTLLATSTKPVPLNIHVMVCCKATIHDSTGSAAFYLNGFLFVEVTGADTQNDTTSNVTIVRTYSNTGETVDVSDWTITYGGGDQYDYGPFGDYIVRKARLSAVISEAYSSVVDNMEEPDREPIELLNRPFHYVDTANELTSYAQLTSPSESEYEVADFVMTTDEIAYFIRARFDASRNTSGTENVEIFLESGSFLASTVVGVTGTSVNTYLGDVHQFDPGVQDYWEKADLDALTIRLGW